MVLLAVNMVLIGYFSVSTFVYYSISGTGLTSNDMIAVLLTNSREAVEFIESHVGVGLTAISTVLVLLYLVGIGLLLWIVTSTE